MTPSEYELRSQFEQLKLELATDDHAVRRGLPLAHWALPADRGLPFALLDQSVDEITQSSYHDIAGTPGIGPKKIGMLVQLLRRAAEDDRAPSAVDARRDDKEAFDESQVSEADWQQWLATIRRWHLQRVKLGYLAVSLRDLPTVLWETRLGEFDGMTLHQLRERKTYGEKRVAAVLRIVHDTVRCLHAMEPAMGLSAQLRPAVVVDLEEWACAQYAGYERPSLEELRSELVLPLLNQLLADGGENVHHVAAGRLGIESSIESVRRQARQLGVTRARVYQLIETSKEIIRVRWPEGYGHLHGLSLHFGSRWPDQPAEQLFNATRALLFPLRPVPSSRPEPVAARA